MFDCVRTPALLHDDLTKRLRESEDESSRLASRPRLAGGIIGLSKTVVADSKCQVKIRAWVRNEQHVATSARIVDVSILNLQGEPFPFVTYVPPTVIPASFAAYVPQLHTASDLPTLLQKRLEYGERIEGIVAYLVDASEVNIDTSRTMMTVADDFDQITELRL